MCPPQQRVFTSDDFLVTQRWRRRSGDGDRTESDRRDDEAGFAEGRICNKTESAVQGDEML